MPDPRQHPDAEAHGPAGGVASGAAASGGVASVARWFVLAALVVLQLARLEPVLNPTYASFNHYDESLLVAMGRRVAEGELPRYADFPLASLLYALPASSAGGEDWILRAATLGRHGILALLWVGVLAVAVQLAARPRLRVPLLVLPVLFATAPFPVILLSNSSDAMAAAASLLAFAGLLAFERTGRTSRLVAASLALGLGCLARSDIVLLLASAGLLAAVLARGRAAALRAAALAVAPGVAVVATYLLLQVWSTNELELGSRERFYLAFEQGEGVAHAGLYPDNESFVGGMARARERYGTPEENGYSVARAVARNPSAFGRRLWATLSILPAQAVATYGWGYAVVLFALASRGLLALLARREHRLLAIAGLWPLHLSLFLATFVRKGHLLLAFVVPLALAGLGVAALASRGSRSREPVFWLAGALGTASVGLALGAGELMRAGLVVGLATGLAWLAPRVAAKRGWDLSATHVLALLFATALGAAGGAPRWPEGEPSPALSAAVRHMRTSLPPAARVAAHPWLPVLLAKREVVPVFAIVRDSSSLADLQRWVERNRVDAFLVESTLHRSEPELVRLVDEAKTDGWLDETFESVDGTVRVLSVVEP